MKKLVSILRLYILILLAFCNSSHALKFSKIKIGDEIGKGYNYGYSYHQSFSSTFIYNDNKGNYIVTVSSPNIVNFVTGIAVFSPTGKLLEVEGINLVSCENVERFVNQTLKDVIKEFGDVHADVGSGQCVPTYIGENATLVSFQGTKFDTSYSNTIDGIVYWDILNNTFTKQPAKYTPPTSKNFFIKFLNYFKIAT